MTGQGSRAFLFGFFQDLLILAAIALACRVRFLIEPFPMSIVDDAGPVLVLFAVVKFTFHYFNLYEITLHLSLREFVIRLLVTHAVALIILTLIYFFYGDLVIGRGILALSISFTMILTTAYRLLWGVFSTDVRFAKNVLVLGDGKNAELVLDEIAAYRNSGYKVAGVISNKRELLGREIKHGAAVLGPADELIAICRARDVDLIIVALDEARGNLPFELLLDAKVMGVRIVESTMFHEQFRGKIVIEGLRASWFIFSEGFVISRMTQVAKRVFDVVTSFGLLIVTAPICGLVTLLIWMTSKGPIFYRQERVGLRGSTFQLLKFRSMRIDSEADGPQFAQENDPRVTWIGRIIRRFRIDEIPQIINVLSGAMSFVGPRPERPFFVQQLARTIPFYSQRHVVKPGITGWAQVRFPYGASLEDSKEKLQLDLYYIKNMSMGFDIKILFETVGVVLGKMKVH